VWGDGGAYGAWAAYLDQWSSNLAPSDGAGLPVVAREDFAPQTWVRLTDRILDAINGRLRLWSTAVGTDLSVADSEFAAGRALVNGRVGITAVLALAEHPSLPSDLREQLRRLVEQQIRSVQQSLEEQIDRLDQQGVPRMQVEQRRRTLRDNPLTAALAAPAYTGPPAPPADPWAAVDITQPRARRLAID
jgi:hypothetical protein